MAITMSIKNAIDDALDSGAFDPKFMVEITSNTSYEFLIKLLGELGHDVSVKRTLLTSPKISNGSLSWAISLRQAIIENDVLKALMYGREVLNLLQK